MTGDQLFERVKRMKPRRPSDRSWIEARIAEARRELFSPFAAAARLEQRERMLLALFARALLERLEKSP